MNLRERKKLRTRKAISDAAIALFLEHGFDQVSITQVAEAAEVSRRTLFAYFPAKEDLVIQRLADHETEAARVVRERPEPPVSALRAHFLERLRERDPITGLCELPAVLALYRLIQDTPALMNRMIEFHRAGNRALADALLEKAAVSPLVASLAADQLTNVRWWLALGNNARIAGGTSADDAYPAAVEAAEQAFGLLVDGLGSAGMR
ncbi:AcrR family transcriptional regulator [Amycolatopsis bartoniae]|uniref:TetR family transcriptional regulator n=1 Tax=Amycolatopsis bartoniae TaxID=941986 RepID=A0A8H9IRW6_9PSEU|nr:TetR family transcriptional regulator [Amycolatopsis bartoniae]MBB2934988.1 AcrR family transcriptional regulator [Amycolatopsis bartoniae]TVT01971.1 TetR family transcriptional regulator [Amycolatopsis bartoniae]GHF43284.1 TetR family transcriptional regulator [Amycolatopsis bartoniae]